MEKLLLEEIWFVIMLLIVGDSTEGCNNTVSKMFHCDVFSPLGSTLQKDISFFCCCYYCYCCCEVIVGVMNLVDIAIIDCIDWDVACGFVGNGGDYHRHAVCCAEDVALLNVVVSLNVLKLGS